MSSCARSPSERMCYIVRGGEKCGGRRGKVCCSVGEMRGGVCGGGMKGRVKCVGVGEGCGERCGNACGGGVRKCVGVWER